METANAARTARTATARYLIGHSILGTGCTLTTVSENDLFAIAQACVVIDRFELHRVCQSSHSPVKLVQGISKKRFDFFYRDVTGSMLNLASVNRMLRTMSIEVNSLSL